LWNSHTLAHKSGIGLIIYDQFYNIHQQMIMLSHLHAIVNFLEWQVILSNAVNSTTQKLMHARM